VKHGAGEPLGWRRCYYASCVHDAPTRVSSHLESDSAAAAPQSARPDGRHPIFAGHVPRSTSRPRRSAGIANCLVFAVTARANAAATNSTGGLI
jgi:hypothetical protein